MCRLDARRLGYALILLASLPALASAQLGPPDFPAPFALAESSNVARSPLAPPKVETGVSPNTGMPRLEPPSELKNYSIAELAMQSSDYMDARYVANSQNPDAHGVWEKLRDGSGEQLHRLVQDYKNFYLSENLLYVGLAVAVAAPIANTQADQNFSTWYQRQAGNSTGANKTALAFKDFGETKYVIPAYLILSASGHLFPDDITLSTLGTFSDRSLRALAVGAPTVGVLQVGLGSDRPFVQDSHWHPFQSNHGVSGHAFVGAVSFLTAASMIECQPLQALLFVGSLAPAWSRIQTNDHYLSQALLGWSIGLLSVRAVNQTEAQLASPVQIVPVEFPRGAGLGVRIQY